ncbi:DDE-type integrase/transposase/recombinase [Labrys sp. La1]|uniref:DDE-type integrase/transposase/recombinase n=1 Tax=Labrys sp. La1 TaxID=3404917 RepID=UPI003EB98A70
MYLCRAIDSVGDAVEFWFSQHRDLLAAKRFLRKACAAPWSTRSYRNRRELGQPGSDYLLRCREPFAGSIAPSIEGDPHPQEPIYEQQD